MRYRNKVFQRSQGVRGINCKDTPGAETLSFSARQEWEKGDVCRKLAVNELQSRSLLKFHGRGNVFSLRRLSSSSLVVLFQWAIWR